MAFDDFEVVAYKVLAYLYACLKEGVSPSVDKARELTRVNEVYFDAVVSSLLADGLVTGSVLRDMNGTVMDVDSLTLTLEGAAYLKDNSTMSKVKHVLGAAFDKTLGVEPRTGLRPAFNSSEPITCACPSALRTQ